MTKDSPRYLSLDKKQLQDRISRLNERLRSCELCPHECRINRLENETGICMTGKTSKISSYMPHFGEEDAISGTKGSGTVFFSGCNLRCCFCQNHEISILNEGHFAEPGHICSVMLHLQKIGCHNLNLVTPTHVMPQILEGLKIAVDHGFSLPIVYNSSGYDAVCTLEFLDGIIDIYMPDFKFWDQDLPAQACGTPDYPEVAKKAIREMHRQVGDLTVSSDNLALSGLLIRHLVMPDGLNETKQILHFLKTQISEQIHVNLMSQYRPCADAGKIPTLSRPTSPAEYRQAVWEAKRLDINLV